MESDGSDTLTRFSVNVGLLSQDLDQSQSFVFSVSGFAITDTSASGPQWVGRIQTKEADGTSVAGYQTLGDNANVLVTPNPSTALSWHYGRVDILSLGVVPTKFMFSFTPSTTLTSNDGANSNHQIILEASQPIFSQEAGDVTPDLTQTCDGACACTFSAGVTQSQKRLTITFARNSGTQKDCAPADQAVEFVLMNNLAGNPDNVPRTVTFKIKSTLDNQYTSTTLVGYTTGSTVDTITAQYAGTDENRALFVSFSPSTALPPSSPGYVMIESNRFFFSVADDNILGSSECDAIYSTGVVDEDGYSKTLKAE